jgi:hypothetical protein
MRVFRGEVAARPRANGEASGSSSEPSDRAPRGRYPVRCSARPGPASWVSISVDVGATTHVPRVVSPKTVRALRVEIAAAPTGIGQVGVSEELRCVPLEGRRAQHVVRVDVCHAHAETWEIRDAGERAAPPSASLPPVAIAATRSPPTMNPTWQFRPCWREMLPPADPDGGTHRVDLRTREFARVCHTRMGRERR